MRNIWYTDPNLSTRVKVKVKVKVKVTVTVTVRVRVRVGVRIRDTYLNLSIISLNLYRCIVTPHQRRVVEFGRVANIQIGFSLAVRRSRLCVLCIKLPTKGHTNYPQWVTPFLFKAQRLSQYSCMARIIN